MPILPLLYGSRFPLETIAVINQAYDCVVKALGLKDSAACARTAKMMLDLAEELILFDAAELSAAALARIRGAKREIGSRRKAPRG